MTGNNEMHLKNFPLYQPSGDVRQTPLHMNTKLYPAFCDFIDSSFLD